MNKPKTPQKKTEVEISVYKENPILKIWEIREDGHRKDSPLISFGTYKAKALAHHIEDIEAFIEGN